ncbi:hypothetical protein RSK20926_02759 [Roseobacter sp. SK209-2-6]|nr:hypothetical protein RSK20926_02759 [Roseobacter sp. SK209-2-6]
MTKVNQIQNSAQSAPNLLSPQAISQKKQPEERQHMETRKRSLVKAVIWNLMGLATMTLVGLAATGSVTVGGIMAAVNTAVGFACYLVYERVWTRISWGRANV